MRADGKRGWLGRSDEIDLVKDVVIAIRVSLDNYRREFMKNIMVDAFTFEVARAVDIDLSERIGDGFSSKMEQQRLVAVILALKELGLVTSDDDGRTMCFCFGQEAKELVGDVSDERLMELAAHNIRFKLRRSEMLHSIELSQQYRDDVDQNVVRRSWGDIGNLIDMILDGRLRLIGPASQGGLIVEHPARSTPDEKSYVLFSLGNKTHEEAIMVDLSEPLIFEGHTRFPIKADGQLFVTLGLVR
jgi:hypothetical protein